MYVEYEVEYENDDSEMLMFTGLCRISATLDRSYGEDADGNGGVERWVVNDFKVVSCFDELGVKVDVDDYVGLEDVIGVYAEKEAIDNAEEY